MLNEHRIATQSGRSRGRQTDSVTNAEAEPVTDAVTEPEPDAVTVTDADADGAA